MDVKSGCDPDFVDLVSESSDSDSDEVRRVGTSWSSSVEIVSTSHSRIGRHLRGVQVAAEQQAESTGSGSATFAAVSIG